MIADPEEMQLAADINQNNEVISQAAEHALGHGLRVAHQTLFQIPILTGEESLHRGRIVLPDNRKRSFRVTAVTRYQTEAIEETEPAILDRFQLLVEPEEENEHGPAENVCLIVDQEGYVVAQQTPDGQILREESRYFNGLIATPYILLERLWSMKPFDILHLISSPLAYGTPNIPQQLGGWT